MRELLKTPKTMTDTELKDLYASIQKGYDELIERNKQTLEWMKNVGLTK
jgi:hypothetical protein